jgi:hypothetical protein
VKARRALRVGEELPEGAELVGVIDASVAQLLVLANAAFGPDWKYRPAKNRSDLIVAHHAPHEGCAVGDITVIYELADLVGKLAAHFDDFEVFQAALRAADSALDDLDDQPQRGQA